jgi:hypothetical protein
VTYSLQKIRGSADFRAPAKLNSHCESKRTPVCLKTRAKVETSSFGRSLAGEIQEQRTNL